MPSFDQALGIHAHAVLLRSHRAQILATNIANADTPGYQARDIDFRAVLSQQLPATTTATHVGHVGTNDGPLRGHALLYRQPYQASLDQNTVDMHTERAQFLDNAMRYQASLRFLNGRISGILNALRGE